MRRSPRRRQRRRQASRLGRRGQEPEQETASIFIYVCGQVAAPGVYELPAGARVYQAIERAGGTLEGASPES